MKKVWLNKKYIAKLATRWTCGVFSILGFIGTFASLSDLFPEAWSIWNKVLIGAIILASIWIASFALYAIWFSRQKWIEVFEANNDCHVYVQYGDVFSGDEVDKPNERRNVVIPVNRCFDTIVDNDLVSTKTLHGIAFKKLYATGQYDENSLNTELQKDLFTRQGLIPTSISENAKRRGNLQRYDVGSVAEITTTGNCTYFFMALSTFDYGLTAHTTREDYVLAMQRLTEYCNARAQGYPVVIPLVGAGMSKTKNSERAILEYTVKLLKINKDLITNDIHIVVRNSGKETIPITEL